MHTRHWELWDADVAGIGILVDGLASGLHLLKLAFERLEGGSGREKEREKDKRGGELRRGEERKGEERCVRLRVRSAWALRR
jgi:hypothetical protein